MSDAELDPARAGALLATPVAELEAVLSELLRSGEAALALLRALEHEAQDKERRKLVRRALHRLRAQGVSLDEPAREAPASVLRPVAGPEEEGLVTPVDPVGRRLLFLVVPVPRGADVMEIALSDRDGVLGARRHRGRRREARSFLRELRKDSEVVTAAVPGAEIRALVARALAMTADEKKRTELGPLADGAAERTPGERMRAELSGELPDPARAASLVRERIDQGRLLAWPPLGEPLAALARELRETDESPLVLSEVQKAERRSELERERAAHVFGTEERERLAARLEETAVLYLATGDREGAGALVATAAGVREADDPLEVDFLRRALELGLEIAAREAAGPEADEPAGP